MIAGRSGGVWGGAPVTQIREGPAALAVGGVAPKRDGLRDIYPDTGGKSYFAAMHSISTRAFLGRVLTATALRAGKGSVKNWA